MMCENFYYMYVLNYRHSSFPQMNSELKMRKMSVKVLVINQLLYQLEIPVITQL